MLNLQHIEEMGQEEIPILLIVMVDSVQNQCEKDSKKDNISNQVLKLEKSLFINNLCDQHKESITHQMALEETHIFNLQMVELVLITKEVVKLIL